MNQIQAPVQSVKSLLKALVIAVVLAITILLVAVLPAEYGIDPTGLGEKMGLTELAAPTENLNPVEVAACDEGASVQQDIVKIIVPAMSGIEYKFHINKSETLEYSWKTNGGSLYFDFHGEPQGDTTGYFKSYKEATMRMDSGSHTIPFTGSHGWYWKNESSKAVTVILETKGIYQIIGFR